VAKTPKASVPVRGIQVGVHTESIGRQDGSNESIARQSVSAPNPLKRNSGKDAQGLKSRAVNTEEGWVRLQLTHPEQTKEGIL
jgi:hypothetical protein